MNAHALAKTLMEEDFRIISGGTDNHLMLIDTKSSVHMTGIDAEKILDQVNITVNKNTIPYDTEKPFITSGIRIGTPAMTTRGLKEEDFIEIGHIIAEVLKHPKDSDILDDARQRVNNLTKKFPLNNE